jgi:uncharacterized protein (TIGR02300 family)
MQAAGNTEVARRHGPLFHAQSAIDSRPSTSQVKHRFSDIPRIPHVAKSDLGTKRICPTTGKKFYDLNKSPVISPYTGEVVPIAPVAPARAARGEAARATAATAEVAPEPAEAEELVSLEEADAEENTGKVKAVVPESEEDIEVDETIEDDEDDDSTFIADEEEGDEDVTDIIGDVSGDEET